MFTGIGFVAYIAVGIELLKPTPKGSKDRRKEVMATMENTMFLVLVFVALITKEALAAQHAVGGSQGWDESTDFDTWASGQTFKVGDQLGMSLMLDLCKDILILFIAFVNWY